jgi:hypothetical protein
MLIRKILIILISILTLCVFISGCAVHKRMEIAESAKTELVGLSKKDLLSCAGVPTRSDKVDDMEFLTYGSDATGIGFFHRSKRYCEVTFTLKNGVVEKVSYSGNTGGRFTEDEQCAYVIKSCMNEEE